MSTGITHPATQPTPPDTPRNWITVVLTLIFISPYGAGLIGRLKPPADEKMVMRLEPITLVIIGYYSGRLPGLQNERTLKQEINRQTQRADASQSAKEHALQSREALEEKIKNVRAALGSEQTGATSSGSNLFAAGSRSHEEGTRHVVGATLRILSS
jgi:hypothetical protein